jgi:predicted acyl esterase
MVAAANNAAAERGMSMRRNRAEVTAARLYHVGAGGSSVPDYRMKVEKPITVRMRDGIRISLCVYRPDTEGRFPALFAASPYQYEMDDVPAYPLFLWRETGPVEWYVSQGYAYVHADVRGSGQSEGEFEFMGLNEQEDYLELIAWIVAQPWCNGRVGGIGQSYYAMAQWLMATYNPPGLACIAPYDGLVDQYRGSNYHGGIYCSYRSVWYTSLRADNQHRLAGRHGRSPMTFDLVGEIINHPLDDEFWRQRSPYWRLDKIKCPVLSIGHWGKMGLHLRGNILGYEEVKAPKKLVVTGARNTFEAHRMFDQVEFHEKELLPFYDLHLKGANNGFMDAEPVKLFVRGANVWRSQETWPPRSTAVAYYLRKGPSGGVTSLNDGALSVEKPAADEAPTSYTYPD